MASEIAQPLVRPLDTGRSDSTSTPTRYAGFWLRFLAWFVDLVPFLILNVFVRLIAGNAEFGIVVSILAGWLYFALFESSRWQGTLGKLAVGLAVTDRGLKRISFGRATGRYFAKYISTLILLFGYFMAGWNQEKRGLHDMIAGTLVVRRPGRWGLSEAERAGVILGTKVCPACAETVKEAAVVCRHCGFRLSPATEPVAEIAPLADMGVATATVAASAEASCSSCGAARAPEQRFCTSCGNRFGP